MIETPTRVSPYDLMMPSIYGEITNHQGNMTTRKVYIYMKRNFRGLFLERRLRACTTIREPLWANLGVLSFGLVNKTLISYRELLFDSFSAMGLWSIL